MLRYVFTVTICRGCFWLSRLTMAICGVFLLDFPNVFPQKKKKKVFWFYFARECIFSFHFGIGGVETTSEDACNANGRGWNEQPALIQTNIEDNDDNTRF